VPSERRPGGGPPERSSPSRDRTSEAVWATQISTISTPACRAAISNSRRSTSCNASTAFRIRLPGGLLIRVDGARDGKDRARNGLQRVYSRLKSG
jgi:hypothetical protein